MYSSRPVDTLICVRVLSAYATEGIRGDEEFDVETMAREAERRYRERSDRLCLRYRVF